MTRAGYVLIMSKILGGGIDVVIKKKKYLSISLLLILLAAYYLFPVKKEITIIDGIIKKDVVTFKNTVNELFIENDIKVKDNDIIEPNMEKQLVSGMTIKIKRARNIVLIDGGQENNYLSTSEAVYQFINENNIELGLNDKIIPKLDERIEEKIQIIRVSKEIVEAKKDIPYETIKQPDDDLYKGEQHVIKMGQKGVENITYEVTYEDGTEIARQIVNKVLSKSPVTKILAVGTKQIASRGGNSIEFDNSYDMIATGYTHTGNRTYTGIWPSVGIAAVDPKVIPLGTRLYIDGYGFAKAMDIGGAIKGNRIDLFFDTKKEALKWGRRKVKVFVLHQ